MAAAEHRRLLGEIKLVIQLIDDHDERNLQRQSTEQLMGEQMMVAPGTRAPQVPITDPKVCRSYLVGDCPHTLFTNTKHDIGSCPKLHNDVLKQEYQEASEEQKRAWGFEWDYMRDMQKHVDECNRKIEACQRRLEKTAEEIRKTNALVSFR
jgi:hypothetical protein